MKKTMMFAAVAMLAVGMGAAVIADTVDATDGGFGYSASQDSGAYTIQRVLDLSETAVASNDTVQVLNVFDRSLVQIVTVEIETATGSYTTIDTGDGTGASRYLSNTSSTNIATTAAAVTTDKYYPLADTIDLHFDDAPGATGKIRVKALVLPMKADR